MAIDLHVHTMASDGTLSPADLVQYAKARGLEAIAVTDHDSVEGLDEAVAEGITTGLEVVPGVEISADHAEGAQHILGYYLDFKSSALLKRVAVLQDARAERNPKIVRKLQALGFAISFAEIEQEAGSGLVGRPHFAQVLLKKGYVKSMQEAFDKYLKKGAAAYEEKFRFPVPDPFSPSWSLDMLTMVYLGGQGTILGPIIGAVFFVALKQFLVLNVGEYHLIIFGALFILVVLFCREELFLCGASCRKRFPVG